jgi:hypothetical protein
MSSRKKLGEDPTSHGVYAFIVEREGDGHMLPNYNPSR